MKDTGLHRQAEHASDQHDDELAQVISNLYTIYTAPKRPDSVSWSALKLHYQRNHTGQQSTRPSTHLRPMPRLSLRASIVLMLLLITLLTVGTVYAQMNGLIEDVLNLDPGASQLQHTHQLVTTSMSQSIQGFTVTLQKVYSDANRIIVGSTVQAPPHLNNLTFLGPYQATLYNVQSDGGTIALKSLGGQGKQGTRSTAFITSFDASSIQGNPTTLHLKYVVKGIAYEKRSDPQRSVAYGESIGTEHIIPGPLTFTITVPFHTGMVFTVGESQTGPDGTIILDKVLIAPSGVQIFLHKSSTKAGRQWAPLALTMSPTKSIGTTYLTVGNNSQQYQATRGLDTMDSTNSNTFSLLIPDALANKGGNWTLHLIFGNQAHPGQIAYTLTFLFTVPTT